MNWTNIASGIAGGLRGYEASKGMDIPGPQQNAQGQNGGFLMDYLRNRQKKKVMGQAQPPTAQQMPMQNTLDAPDPSQYQNPYPGIQPQPMAQGRIVDKPTTALLGEDGPEAVIPLSGRADARVSPGLLMKYQRRG